MALQKNRQYNNTEVKYWKVSGVNISYTGGVAQIFVIGFANEDLKQEGLENKVVFENFICKGEDFINYFGIAENQKNPAVCSYNYLKDKVTLFDGSTDI